MIVLEDRLKEIFDQLPSIVIGSESYPVTFGYGDQKELNLFLRAKQNEDSVYPLIWLVYPVLESHNYTDKNLESDIKLIVAVRNDKVHWLNEQRYKTTYSTILIPLLEKIIRSFKGTKIATIIQRDEKILYEIVKHPNYSNTDKRDEHYTTDIWDAIELRISLLINKCKIDTINF